MSMIFDLCEVEEKIQYTFTDKNLLRQAFTHSSYSNEQRGKSNEQLEFLGDSILNFVVAEYLYKKYPDSDEGELTKMRAGLVSATPLSEVIEAMDLSRHILLGVGESKFKTHSYNISAELFEAVTAAIYLDGGLEAARSFISMSLLTRQSGNERMAEESIDCKSRLMELSQKLFKSNVQYKLLEQTGPAHNPVFTVQVIVNGDPLAKASGKSKKAAEQLAAQYALEKLDGSAEPQEEPPVRQAAIKPAKPSPMAFENKQTAFTELDDAFVDIYADEDFGRPRGKRSGRKSSVRTAFNRSQGRSAKPDASQQKGAKSSERAEKKSDSPAQKGRRKESKPQKQFKENARAKGAAAKPQGKPGKPGSAVEQFARFEGNANRRKAADKGREPARTSQAPAKKKIVLPRWLGKKG